MFFRREVFNRIFFGSTITEPTPSAFDRIEITGAMIVDDIHVRSIELSESNISSIDINIEPTWTVSTILLALFNNNLQAGNLINLPSVGVRWILNRRALGDAVFTTVHRVGINEPNSSSFIDYRVRNSTTYQYELLLETENEISEPFDSDDVSVFFDFWSIADETTNEVLHVNANRSGSNVTNHSDITVYDNYTQYPVVHKGIRNYDTGSITALSVLGDVSVDEQTASMIDNIKSFSNNQNEKIIKNPKGEIWRAITNNASRSPLSEYLRTQPQHVTINWTEVGEI